MHLLGKNLITPPKLRHWFVKFLISLVSGFQLMMWVGAILCLIVYIALDPDPQQLALAIVLILVILLSCMFQSY